MDFLTKSSNFTALGAGGREFESRRPDHFSTTCGPNLAARALQPQPVALKLARFCAAIGQHAGGVA